MNVVGPGVLQVWLALPLLQRKPAKAPMATRKYIVGRWPISSAAHHMLRPHLLITVVLLRHAEEISESRPCHVQYVRSFEIRLPKACVQHSSCEHPQTETIETKLSNKYHELLCLRATLSWQRRMSSHLVLIIHRLTSHLAKLLAR